MRKLRFLSPLLVTTVLIACGSDDPTGPDGGEGGQGPGTGGASADGSGGAEGGAGNLPSNVEETIGEEGGTVDTESASLDFPAGALPDGVVVTVAGLEQSEVEALPQTVSDIVLAAVPVAFLPHGLTFDEPVAVALAYDAEAVGDVQLVVMKLDNEDDTTWEIVPGAVFENGQAIFSITSFSVYGVFEDPQGTAEELYSGHTGTGGSGGGEGSGGTGGEDGSGGKGGGTGTAGGGGEDGAGGEPDTGAGGVDPGPAGGGAPGAGGGGGVAGGGTGAGGDAPGAGGVDTGVGGVDPGPAGGGASPGGGTGAGGVAGGGTGAGGDDTGAGGVDPGPAGGGAPGAGGGGGVAAGGGTGAGGDDTGAGGDDSGAGGGGVAAGGGLGAGGSSPGAGGGIGMGGVGGVGGVGGGPGGDEDPGFLNGPDWHGYGWTYATPGSEIESDLAYANAPNCAWGETAAGYEHIAILGYNAHETLIGGDNGPALVSGDGVFVDIDNYWGRDLRVQLQANGGANTWCAAYTGPGFIPWDAFNTTCWDPSGGQPFDPALDAIDSAGVAVPGLPDQEGFDFCLRDLHPGAEPTYGYFTHDGFRGDGYIETRGDATVFGESMSSRFELPVFAAGDFSLTPDSDVALWFNLNQSEPGGVEDTIVPSLDGVQIQVDAHNGEWMHVVISDGSTTWCAPHFGGWQEFVPWNEFNTSCDGGAGVPYAFEPISSLGVRFKPSPQNLENEWTEFDVQVASFHERAFENEGYLEHGEYIEVEQEECYPDGMGGEDCFTYYIQRPSMRGYGALNLAGGASGWSNLNHTSSNNYCSTGTLPAGIDASAELLFALNQENDHSLVAPVTVTNAGARISVDNNGGTLLHAILVADDGTRYCYPFTGVEEFVPWEEFNSECDGSGTMLFPDVLLTHGGIAVPPSIASETEYDFCFHGFEARGEPTFGYYQGMQYSGQGSIEVGGTSEVSSETLSTNEHTPFCMQGTLGAQPEDFARMRFAANQMPGGPQDPALPEGDGLAVSYELMMGEKARIVLTTDSAEFCADVTEPWGQELPWADFVDCGTGTPYAMEPFVAISIEIVPGGASDFDTCFWDLMAYEEGGGGPGMGGSGGGPIGGGPLNPPAGRTDFNPGFIDDGTWAGEGYTFASDFSSVSSTDVADWDGPTTCAAGDVGEAPEEFASLGYNVANGTPTAATGDGVWVELRESYGREHRLNIVNTVTSEYWCASLGSGNTPGPVFVPWTSLNSSCWDGMGTNFDPGSDEFSLVEIQVPSDGMDSSFEFCIDRLQSGLSSDF